jgi:hypothetical protein
MGVNLSHRLQTPKEYIEWWGWKSWSLAESQQDPVVLLSWRPEKPTRFLYDCLYRMNLTTQVTAATASIVRVEATRFLDIQVKAPPFGLVGINVSFAILAARLSVRIRNGEIQFLTLCELLG